MNVKNNSVQARIIRASSATCVEARSTGISARARCEQGQSTLEFALLLPLLMTLLFGVIVFGMALNNYIVLTNAAAAGVQALSISRGQTTNPCTTVTAPFYAAAPNLAQASILFTITVTPPPGGSGSSYTLGSANTASPTCSSSSTTTGAAADLVEGDTATVKATYPCNLKFFGYTPSAGCTLTAQTAESIQ